MGGLNVHADDQNSPSASQKKKWNKSPKLIIGLAVLIAIPIIGTTLAGQVTVNTTNNITFGQGFSAALPCDPDVVITPYASFHAGAYYLTSVVISSLDTTEQDPNGTPGAGCLNQTLTLAATKIVSGLPETIEGSATTFVVTGATSTSNTKGSSSSWAGGDDGVAVLAGNSINTTVTITYPLNISSHIGVALASNPSSMAYFDVTGFTIQEN
jgi:hypothetical protein